MPEGHAIATAKQAEVPARLRLARVLPAHAAQHQAAGATPAQSAQQGLGTVFLVAPKAVLSHSGVCAPRSVKVGSEPTQIVWPKAATRAS